MALCRLRCHYLDPQWLTDSTKTLFDRDYGVAISFRLYQESDLLKILTGYGLVLFLDDTVAIGLVVAQNGTLEREVNSYWWS